MPDPDATEKSAAVKAFVESAKNQAIITDRLQLRARLALRELTGQDVPFDTTITYRLIRFVLKTGEVEVLLTTLLDKKRYPHPTSACSTAADGAWRPV